MVVCKLDEEVSGEILGWKLPGWQALLLHRVLPECGGVIVYLTLICFDIALVYEHYQNGDNGLGIFCIILMVLPAILSLIFTLASPPPGLQTEISAFSVNLQKNDVRWILMQFLNFLLFPVAAIGRYCHQIFWWIEAVCASRVKAEERTREALLRAKAPSPMELYLFLQAFIHSAPHVIVNVLDIMARYSDPAFDKLTVQAVSIVTSTLRMASTATVYRRFEREKLNGKQYPWNTNMKALIDNAVNENIEKENIEEENNKEEAYEPSSKKHSISSQKSSDSKNKINSDLIQFSPRHSDEAHSFFHDEMSDSDLSSNYKSPDESSRRPSAFDSDNEYVRPISIIDKVAPRRRDTQFTIEKVDIPPIPEIPAPRPGSLAVWAEKIVENAESIPSWLSAPPRRKYYEVAEDDIDIPYRVPRAFMRGLEPQDASASLVHFLGWYAFFISRLLSIAAFIDFFPVAATIVLFSHYQIMLLLLIVPQASTVKRGFYIFLSFIYLFCLMEFKIRFRHVRVWHVFWIIVCTIEIVIFTGLWSSIDNNLNDWWRSYVIKVIFVSMLLSYMCFLVYFVLLKPKETIVYVKNNKNIST